MGREAQGKNLALCAEQSQPPFPGLRGGGAAPPPAAQGPASSSCSQTPLSLWLLEPARPAGVPSS